MPLLLSALDRSLLVIPLLPIIFFPLGYLLISRRLGERAGLGRALFVSSMLFGWFSYWLLIDRPLYGLYLSWIGSLGLCIGAAGEAAVLCGQHPFRTALQLLLCAPSVRAGGPS